MTRIDNTLRQKQPPDLDKTRRLPFFIVSGEQYPPYDLIQWVIRLFNHLLYGFAVVVYHDSHATVVIAHATSLKVVDAGDIG